MHTASSACQRTKSSRDMKHAYHCSAMGSMVPEGIFPSSAGDMKHSLHCFLEYALECSYSKAYSLSNVNYVSD